MYILITLEVKNENIPKLFSQYLLKRNQDAKKRLKE